MANEKMIEAVVARGRTVHDQVNKGTEKDPVIEMTLFTEGQKFRGTEAEVKRLRDLGYLVPEKVDEPKLQGARISGGSVSINESE